MNKTHNFYNSSNIFFSNKNVQAYFFIFLQLLNYPKK